MKSGRGRDDAAAGSRSRTAVTDEELVRRVRDGEQDAYRLLVDRYAPMIFQIVHRFEQDDEEKQDLAQEIFIKAYRALDRFKEQARFSSWLYAVAQNHCRDHVKQARRRKGRFVELGVADEAGELVHPDAADDALVEIESTARVQWALSQLSPDDAQLFLLKYRDNLPYSEIAEQLGSTEGALKVRLYRARLALQKLLENWK